jgi:hypothetical protein
MMLRDALFRVDVTEYHALLVIHSAHTNYIPYLPVENAQLLVQFVFPQVV